MTYENEMTSDDEQLQERMDRTLAATHETDKRARFTTVHDRYHVGCSCCGLVTTEAKKNPAIDVMIGHMKRHPEDDELTFVVFDSMHRGGSRAVYGGRIHNHVSSHGFGVGYSVKSGRPCDADVRPQSR